MRNLWFNTGHVALLAAGLWMAGLSYPAQAQEESSVVLPPPAGAQAAPAERPATMGDAAACCSMAAPAAQPCIEYHTSLSALAGVSLHRRKARHRDGQEPG